LRQGNRIKSRLNRKDAKDAKEKRGERQKWKNLQLNGMEAEGIPR